MNRRSFVTSIPTGMALAGSSLSSSALAAPRKGRLKQSVTGGVFGRTQMSFEDRAKKAAEMGVVGYDLVTPDQFPILKKYGLVPAMVRGGGTLTDNMNHKENHAKLEPEYRAALKAASEAGAPNVIALSGNRRGINDQEGLDNCVALLTKLKGQAEDQNVTICMELLNSKVNHPDYQCDRTSWGVELCKRVGSPRVKLLYDIYHMQIMEGDVIRTIRANFQYLGHFHTAGNPGRHEMDDTQEMNYRGIAKAIADLNYTGYVAHEYSPLGDAMTSLENTLKMFEV